MVLRGFVALIVAGFIWWCWSYPSTWIEYRLTLEVDTPEGPRSGSGVWMVTSFLEPPLFGSKGGASNLDGEAIPVDLGDRGTLFVLLASRGEDGLPRGWTTLRTLINHFAPEAITFRSNYLRNRTLSRVTGTADLATQEIPYLVRFRDINDPTSVEAVDPNDLAKSFGQGVSLKRANIEILSAGRSFLRWIGIDVRDKTLLSAGIEKRLHWLRPAREKSIDPSFSGAGGPVSQQPLYRLLKQGDFWRH